MATKSLRSICAVPLPRRWALRDEALDKPIVGILNTYSELNNCHRHLPQLVEAVKRGVWQAGGFPLEFPTISLGEIFLSPTSMLYRNLMAMDAEAMIRAQPLDAVVLIRRLRQDAPRPADGRGQRRTAGDRALRRVPC